ncbi:F-box/kelch-repeat protein At3g27150-like [Chenopodium quinoa]|uniref:F-box/kelch-repeat protein At3g27150-like n=1 Tax=Chenopodium quinoa TaxID=63459 RepID=UPI000B785D23|nr:F-box/kelch-repeat protein At3g27150-like [Chenopodium quinoa]XP_021727970.1 F-box/kelch-repeat protein At3g27150-like [Chenopodium quinoa]
MSKGKEIEEKQVDMEGNEFDEQEYEEVGDNFYTCESNEEDVIDLNSSAGAHWIVSDEPRPDKIRKSNASSYVDFGLVSLSIQSQDADYIHSHVPQLSDELENMIIARIPLLEFRKLCLLNKKFLALIKNGDLLRERRMIGVREASVFMLASGEDNWWAFDQQFTFHKALPVLPCDGVFRLGDKESLCAGTHLLVCGNELDGPVIWTYDVIMNKWFKGISMIQPRCLFASASSGGLAYVAGGIGLESGGILNSAEKYDPMTRSWEPLPRMKVKRKMCSGVYMDDKFFVIGGQSQNNEVLTCAEVFDEKRNIWVEIPGILNGLTLPSSQSTPSPPLVAVVNNELYTIETSTNSLMVYLKNSNSWRDLGPIPVRADINKGWGVAFKSLGDELLVIGGSTISLSGRGMTIYTCCPYPSAETLNWKLLDDGGGNRRSHFIMNCTVMVA